MSLIVEHIREKGYLVVMWAIIGLLAGGLAACAPEPAQPAVPDTPTPTPTTAATATETATRAAPEPDPETAPTPTLTQTPAPASEALDHGALLDEVLYGQVSLEEAQAILGQISDSDDTRFVGGLIDTIRYQRALSPDVGAALNALTGQDLAADWFEWVEWAGNHPEIESFADYPAWKAALYSRIDPGFVRFLYDGVKVAPDSRVEEIVWGGVRVDGIPALDNPTMIDPAEADYLLPHERVFGVSINGDVRAYPARFLDWHEMFNDVVGGEPVSLAY
jgi:hypothetical protein